ncbi:ATP-dependent helicase HrpB [Corynebacterium yudongzhengii]|uniref:ATP-dependent helicase HrpB n=1 Tax=Corynebacterium yudongzhengii TaxID=2080740 RepID=A0A2U1T5K1_9CORY|nr:ATP-dependent helicase HrpB [Corynebacterium yudongzhengii]AWB81008.1 ATP-dependent helicase HrpB [Corynebacterium yudongzhengii]PWC01253.1 ATP-dependent helicase HrpB [Corynebacterium yudongzhengii]
MFDLESIGAGLPVAETIARLGPLIDATGSLVVEAPPGTGKTTLVPPALAQHTGGKVLVTAPRRVAVRAAARRLALLDGSELGERVGYSVRGEHYDGSAVEFMTPGVLIRRLLNDPGLESVTGVIFDEVHERQLDTDLVLGMVAELRALREDLQVVAMSATLDARRFAELLDGANILSTPAVTHPLEIDYQPHPGRIEGTREFYAHLARLAEQAVARRGESALVFVPGVREVELVLGALSGDYPALPLHGRLKAREQDAALARFAQPRIVVSTAVAESSLTVPGVRIVVDSGLSRVPRRDSLRGMTGLVTISAAVSTADQRAGRAGREGPGWVIRAYAESDYQHFAAHITPEIATSDLTDAALNLAVWGTPRGEGLALLDPPPPRALHDAEDTLRALHAIDDEGRATDTGHRLAALPLDPRLAAALDAHGRQAADVIAVLSESPTGDVGRARVDKRVARRLQRLVADKGPVSAGRVVASAFPQWVARRAGEDDYLLASGTRARLPGDYGLRGAEWLAVADVSRTQKGSVIRAAARIDEADALAAVGVEERVVATLHEGSVRGRKVRRAGAIELSSTPVRVAPDQAASALADSVSAADFTYSPKAAALRDRLAFLHEQCGEPWPDPARADVGPELEHVARGTPLAKVDMYPAMQRILPWPEASRLDDLAPSRLHVPSGSNPRIDYSTGRPVVRVKLQECFGMTTSPECAGVKVQFHLLSPAGRPLAVTDDLESFFSGPYQEVRKDMRGRYPKHPWPEDPWTATATAKTTARTKK